MKGSRKNTPLENPFLELTWMDIQEWAGSKILSRGKSYQRSGSVEELAITKKNEIVAWVEGSTRYATRVSFKRGKLSSSCTCPYGTNCKHAVAAVIEYLESIKKKKDVPIVPESDKRIALIKEGKTAWPHDADEDWDEEFEEEDNGDDNCEEDSLKSDSISGFLKGKSQAELAAIISHIAETHPEVKSELRFKSKLSSSSVSALAKTISSEIDKASAEPGWQNHWNHGGFTPDYSRVRSGLQKLFDANHFDEIVKLGEKLYSRGMEQAGQSDDEGETIQEISEALDIVYQALPRCSLPDVDKLEQAIDWELADEYSLSDGLDKFWKKKFSKSVWSAIADRLLDRLKGLPAGDEKPDFHRDYKRDRLTDQIVRALDHAGRSDERIDLCMQEAPLTGSFDRLVTMLRDAGRTAEALDWIRKGIKATNEELPGIASGLRKQLLEIHTKKRDWLFCAAIKTDVFFDSPSIGEYAELKKVCEKAGVWNKARPKIIAFLNTGKKPKRTDWPLPDTGLAQPARRGYSQPPFTTELIEIALLEKDVDEALRLYDEYQRKSASRSSWGFGWSGGISNQIADAAKEKYPDRSIAIWKKAAEGHIARTSPKEYSIALGYLNRIQKVMKKTGKEKVFKLYIADIKASNRRKIWLVEMLDSMSGKRIVDES